MPNRTGGKNYKKSKHSNTNEPVFIDRQPDQMYARVIKILGSLNVLVFCNDNKTRLCHIRGSMRKKVWINIGDIVLISGRDFETDLTQAGKNFEKGDVVAKYQAEHMNKLKKLPDINKKLFMQLETTDGAVLAEIGKRENSFIPQSEDDLGIDFDDDGKEDTEKNEESATEDSDKDVNIDDI
jgi:translation initiation factor 1A